MSTRLRRFVISGVCCVLLLSQAPHTAQDLSDTYRALARVPAEVDLLTKTARWCGNTFDFLRKALTGVSATEPLGEGSVTPRWPATELAEFLRQVRWGMDRPNVFWGSLILPKTSIEPAFGQQVTEDEIEKVAVILNMRPPGIPASPVTAINGTVQFSSHVVNMWIPGFGDSRVNGGNKDLNLAAITNAFYQHFTDDYDVISVVSQVNQLPGYGGFHRAVRNDILGIGLPFFDNSAVYGSSGVLQGVEFYPHSLWALNATMLHETGHQWGEYSQVWDPLGPTLAPTTLDRKGHEPDVHTPLLTPGGLIYGAVLEAERRVGTAALSAASHAPGYVIERTMPLITFNPLTLYRMGHLTAAALPTYQVFANQGQFDEDTSTAPEVGTAVVGDHYQVAGADFIAADGARSGPVVTQIRRAVIYVSRAGLVSKGEMDILNYFAARFASTEGVTSWDRYPSFFEATGGKAKMTTAITPRPAPTTTSLGGRVVAATPITPGPTVAYAPVATTALIGVRLDKAIPGRIKVGETVELEGQMTLTARSDYSTVCFRLHRYGADDPSEIFECAALAGDRFSIDVSFSSQQTGTYTVEDFVFWPDSGSQYPLSWYGTIVVE